SGAHLDADEISIFAENALNEAAKPRVIKHLADCDRCRTILSNTIVLNSEAGEDSAPVAVPGGENLAASSIDIPWYKKLFATRNLAFGLGALVVIFAGMFGFLAVQRSLNSGTMDMAKVSEDSANTAAPSADAGSIPDSAASNSNTATESNTESLGESNTGSNTAESIENKGKPLSTPASPDSAIDKEETTTGYSGRQTPGKLGPVSATKDAPENRRGNAESADRARDEKSKVSDQDQAADDSSETNVVASRSAPPPPPKPAPVAAAEKPSAKMAGQAAKKREERPQAEAAPSGEIKEAGSRIVGGKKFTLKDRVWYDSKYSGQKTTNIRRKTEDYKKLDSGLRSIADKFSGTVVVVWKSAAYRIN
ncbi:MAG: hypothetical protein KDB79_00745, partial [Acidobacteria bacterium]|nr:hypothetical protein [Acidobacteriota bacterium]